MKSLKESINESLNEAKILSQSIILPKFKSIKELKSTFEVFKENGISDSSFEIDEVSLINKYMGDKVAISYTKERNGEIWLQFCLSKKSPSYEKFKNGTTGETVKIMSLSGSIIVMWNLNDYRMVFPKDGYKRDFDNIDINNLKGDSEKNVIDSVNYLIKEFSSEHKEWEFGVFYTDNQLVEL